MKNKKEQISAFVSEQKSASDLVRRPSSPGLSLIADQSRPHTDQYLESILVDNIGTSEIQKTR